MSHIIANFIQTHTRIVRHFVALGSLSLDCLFVWCFLFFLFLFFWLSDKYHFGFICLSSESSRYPCIRGPPPTSDVRMILAACDRLYPSSTFANDGQNLVGGAETDTGAPSFAYSLTYALLTQGSGFRLPVTSSASTILPSKFGQLNLAATLWCRTQSNICRVDGDKNVGDATKQTSPLVYMASRSDLFVVNSAMLGSV